MPHNSIQTEKFRLNNTAKNTILAFLAPIAVLSIVLVILDAYPFGSRTIVNSDLYSQFLPLMLELKRAVAEGSGIFYSFNGGLGTDFFVLNTYQNASPITWLFLLLFREDQMVLCATLLFMVKAGLSSAAMYYYLQEIHEDDKQAPLIALSALYSLCGYVLGFFYNLFWLECVMLLPLIVLGMRRVVDRKGSYLYIISLALMLFSSYYIGLMVYIFLFVYFFIYFFSENKEHFFRTFLRIQGLSVISILLAMVVLLPTYVAITKTGNYETMGEEDLGLFYFSLPVHLMQLLPGCKVTIIDGPPNLYSGLITVLLCFMYALNRDIEKRRRIIKTAFLLFVFFCTNFIKLDVAWQLGHPPNGFPNRYSFVFSFLAVEMAAESLSRIDSLSGRRTVGALAGIMAVYAIALMGGNDQNLDTRFILMFGAVLLAAYALLFLVLRTKDIRSGSIMIAAVILFELLINTTYGLGAAGVVENDRLLHHKEEVEELIAKVAEEDPFARLEVFGTDNLNAPYLYGYKGTSMFASSAPGDTYRLLSCLWESPLGTGRSFMYAIPNPVADSMVDLSYYISMDHTLNYPWITEIARTDNCYLYKSNYRTSIGYMVPDTMEDLNFDGTRNELLNDFVKKASGMDDEIVYIDTDIKKWDNAFPRIYDELFEPVQMKGNRLSGTVNAKKDGILMMSIPYDEGWSIRVDGETIKDFNSIRYFVSFPLKAGSHDIEMVYYPPKFKPGAIISTTLLIALLCVIIMQKMCVKGYLQWITKWKRKNIGQKAAEQG